MSHAWEGKTLCKNTGRGQSVRGTPLQKLDVSQQCVLAEKKGNSFLGCTNRSTASTPREVSISLYSAFIGLCLEYIQFGDLQYRKDIDKLE